jgi:hypothetical protein
MRETCFIGTPMKDAPPGASIAILSAPCPQSLSLYPCLEAVRCVESIRTSFNQAIPYAKPEEQCPMCRQAVCKEMSESERENKMSLQIEDLFSIRFYFGVPQIGFNAKNVRPNQAGRFFRGRVVAHRSPGRDSIRRKGERGSLERKITFVLETVSDLSHRSMLSTKQFTGKRIIHGSRVETEMSVSLLKPSLWKIRNRARDHHSRPSFMVTCRHS